MGNNSTNNINNSNFDFKKISPKEHILMSQQFSIEYIEEDKPTINWR